MRFSLSLPLTTIVPHANSLDPDETSNYSASHPDPSCLNTDIFTKLSDLEALRKLKQTRNLADDNLFGRLEGLKDKAGHLQSRPSSDLSNSSSLITMCSVV